MANASAGRSALSRHLRILSAFNADSAFLTLTQLSRRAGLPLASTHRLVTELESHGLLERNEDKTYRLGVRLWELACCTPGALGLREIAMPYLQDVHAVVGQHTQLGILEGTDVLFLERLSKRNAVVNATLIGGRLPLHASSSGLVLLAHMPSAFVDQIVNDGLFSYTNHTIRSLSELTATLSEIRSRGFVVADGYIHPDARGIAVPVFGANQVVVAAISVVVPNDETPWEATRDILRRAAQQMSLALRSAYLPPRHPQALPGGRYRPLVNSSVKSMEYLGSTARRYSAVPTPRD
ncbi:IclR family transcriptional regulator [Cryobacterium melibiosiphilum]|uniref:IclR family transcriptional regulator n=1 Tax=Cryobacterium melibiosiphilum TaxID=995039 RepID=A0A3A5MC46_9MICO|nr:IclR family transcriptional regulator [Cryobacterium melibiosiphilum]RJT85144.1 IclR family transcriptional regulator [Cryobacterium melibiosiphilum]